MVSGRSDGNIPTRFHSEPKKRATPFGVALHVVLSSPVFSEVLFGNQGEVGHRHAAEHITFRNILRAGGVDAQRLTHRPFTDFECGVGCQILPTGRDRGFDCEYSTSRGRLDGQQLTGVSGESNTHGFTRGVP